MDMYLSNFATCFPMITKPSIVQLDLDYVNDDTLAINFVVCKPLDYHQLLALPPDNAGGAALVYMDIFSNLATVATNGINFSIDFLPHIEYVLYRVVQLIAPNDPTGILQMNYPPTNVVIFQGSPLLANSYMPSSSKRLPTLLHELVTSQSTPIIITCPSSSTAMENPTTESSSMRSSKPNMLDLS
jgi:hypothetical protein